MDHKQTVYGVDVSKAKLVMGEYHSEQVMQIDNAAEPIARWLASLPQGSVVAMEATGCYSELLAHLAQAAGMLVYVLNPRALRHYARALELRAKTDRVDALLIARYAMHERAKLRAWQAPSPSADTLSRLLRRRQVLVTARQTLMQSLSGMSALKAQRQSLQASLKRMIANLELLIRVEIGKHAEIAALYRRLTTIVGVGPIVGAQLVAALMRFEFARQDAFIAYTGLDPRPDDSGTRRGRRRLSKHGPGLLRCLLFNAARAATRSKLFKPLYQQLLARGLQTTEALVVVARKLARIAFALFKSGAVFEAQRHLKTA
jgi:transposase